jgi:3-oxosteroid 1-dehydrogenase
VGVNQFDVQADVVIVGSGVAGATGAICARASGFEVIILEKNHLLGGTTALSGGGIWAPCNRFMRAYGADSFWRRKNTCAT